MALQGTLETFALADVLRLLASTKKSGTLRIDGDRGHGELSVVDGELVGASASRAPRAERPAEVLFELLRYESGSFIFDGDDEVVAGEHRASVDEALADAEEQLREWREIEAVVSSPTRLVTLVAERDKDITLTARQWSAVVALGAGATSLELSERMGVAELPATRMVRDLHELGAVVIGEEVAAGSLASLELADVVVSPLDSVDDVNDEADPEPIGDPIPDATALDEGDDVPQPIEAHHEPAGPDADLVLDDSLGDDTDDDDPGESLDNILAAATTPPPPPPPSAPESNPVRTIDLDSAATDEARTEPDAPAAFRPAIVPDPPAAPRPAMDHGAPLSFADAPSLIDEPGETTAPPPPPGSAPPSSAPLFAPTESSGSAFAPPSAFAPASPPAFASPPPPPAPPAAFAPPAETISGWNDDDDDDGLSGFHSDDDAVPLFGASDESPGPDDPFGPDPFTIPNFSSSPSDAKEAEEAAELARQLANLSPRAQQAVAAAAAAGTDEERAQAIARAEQASDEPINRNLLLKYLSSVDE